MHLRWSLPTLLLGFLVFSSSADAGDWPRFRGPNGEGISDDKSIPVTWTEKDGILWKVKIPGLGNSSPVSWGNRLFLQTASDDGKERQLVCLSTTDGKTIWAKSVSGATAHTHQRNTLASSTPATDGERVYCVFWDGSDVALYAYDFEGKSVWTQKLGKFTSQHGAGASPVVYDGKVILNNDQDGDAVLLAFDAKTGKPAWKAPRQAFRACYSTPFMLQSAGNPAELIVASTGGITSYDPQNGKENWNWTWTFARMALRTVGSPIHCNGVIMATSGDGSGERFMTAIKAGGKGDVTKTNTLWDNNRIFPYVPTMLARGEHIYFVNDFGIAGCRVARTGEEMWTERLGGNVSASPLMIDGKIYIVTEEGEVHVIAAAPKFEKLAKNPLGELVRASPAVADGKLFIRGKTHLFCIGKPSAK